MAYVTTESALRFGMDFLARQHQLQRGNGYFGQSCRWSRNGEVHSSVGYDLDLSADAPYLRLHYTHARTTQMDYRVRLVTTRPHYGGERWWFVCPLTGKRCAVLYSPAGQPYFGSRLAFKLKYPSQNENGWDRLLRRYHKRKEQYGAPEWADGWFPRPKGMHQRTYEQRVAELDRLNLILDGRFIHYARKLDPDLLKRLGL